MSRVLEVPYGQLGDMTKRQAMNLSVLRVDDGASLSTTYAQAKTRAPMLHTTSPSAPFVKSRMPHKFDDAPAPPLVRDVAFARWEVLPLSANLTLDEVLSQVVRVNEGATASYTPKQNLILKIKVRFSDASEITFVRQDVNRPDSLRYAGFYSALSPSGGDSATPPKSANPFANSASAAFTRKGPVNSRLPDITTGLTFPTKDERKALFRRFDPNGNGVLSLAELDKAVTELWPSFNIKPAIMRAYRAADLDGSGLLGANEFEAFLRYLINYHKVWTAFSKIDANRDRRVSLDEFVAAAKRLEPSRSEAELTAAFRKIDKNGAGYILFDEFCAAMVADRPNIMNHIPPQPLDRIATTSSASAAASKSASGKSFSKRLKQLEMPDAARRKQIFKQLDPNGNGLLSLAELDKGVVELWPDFNHKPALMRAYRAADVNRSGFVGKAEFEFFIRYLVHFNNLWAAFADADADGDRRISLQEFLAVRDRLQVGTESEARQAFAAMDANRGGYVLFEEFCDWMAKHKAQYELQFTQPKVSSIKKPKRPSQTFDMSATSVTALPKPSAEKIAEMWKRADFNGNGMVSLAELDKHVIELWPHFNNKPALMRAYKATDKNGNGTVSRKEFAQFFDFLVHYTNLWAAFESIDRDNDHRVTLKEFTKGAAHLRINATPEKLAQLFSSIDKNGGGFILFDEFCGALAQLKATASA